MNTIARTVVKQNKCSVDKTLREELFTRKVVSQRGGAEKWLVRKVMSQTGGAAGHEAGVAWVCQTHVDH